MPTATWKNTVIAEASADEVETVEGNIYFPASAMRAEHFKSSEHHSVCPWKGRASYYHVEVEGERNENAAWFYPSPRSAASNIEGFVAFWKGVKVEG
jgi:uncharacterized protein (DUF427 family)